MTPDLCPPRPDHDKRSLQEILQRLAERAFAERLAKSTTPLAAVEGPGDLASGVRPRLRIELRRELELAHLREQAELLRGAAVLGLAESLEGRLLAGTSEPSLGQEAWMRRCAEEIDAALFDAVRVEGDLIVCGLLARTGWPRPEALSAAAGSLHDSPATRLVHARALCAAGRWDEARLLLETLEPATLSEPERADQRELSGLDDERNGNSAGALALYERAAACGGGALVDVAAFALALELGREDRADWARERLESRHLSVARRRRLMSELGQRRSFLGRPWSAENRARLERRLEAPGLRRAIGEAS